MNAVRAVALVVLGFLAISATGGSVFLIAHPMGSTDMMPLSVLEHSPFRSFLLPGVFLLVSSGLLGTAVFLLTLFRVCRYGWWIAVQGLVLFGWITIEVIMLREVVWLHYLYWGVAVLLMACGWILRHQASRAATVLAPREGRPENTSAQIS